MNINRPPKSDRDMSRGHDIARHAMSYHYLGVALSPYVLSVGPIYGPQIMQAIQSTADFDDTSRSSGSVYIRDNENEELHVRWRIKYLRDLKTVQSVDKNARGNRLLIVWVDGEDRLIRDQLTLTVLAGPGSWPPT